jgi:hypothetical protein
MGQHPNVILSQDSQVDLGVPKFPKLGLPQLCVQSSDWNEVQSKVVALVNNFPTVCHMPPKRKEVKAILNF